MTIEAARQRGPRRRLVIPLAAVVAISALVALRSVDGSVVVHLQMIFAAVAASVVTLRAGFRAFQAMWRDDRRCSSPQVESLLPLRGRWLRLLVFSPLSFLFLLILWFMTAMGTFAALMLCCALAAAVMRP